MLVSDEDLYRHTQSLTMAKYRVLHSPSCQAGYIGKKNYLDLELLCAEAEYMLTLATAYHQKFKNSKKK